MTQALTQYHSLYESLRSRRIRPEIPRGLDMLASRAGTAVRHRRTGRNYLWEQAQKTADLSPQMRQMSDGVLDQYISDVRELFIRKRQDEDAVRRALAAVREIARRQTGEEPFPVQLMAALAMYHGRVVEMVTGEGKTLTGSIAAPLIAWQHRRLHIFTVNDYLAARDAASRERIYKRCYLDVGAITQEMEPPERAQVYTRGVVYGTPKQIVADWLRDQISLGRAHTAWAARQQVALARAGGQGPLVPGLRAAMVDEADAVLIDEGVVPLIIARSRREDEMSRVYKDASLLATKLDEGPDYEVQHVQRRAELKRRGLHRCHQMFEEIVARGGEAIWKATRRGEELVRQALVAKHCYLRGQQYEIVDGKVVIVDEYTGRFLPDRSWEHGLHQAVEAKESLEVTADRETLARLSFQRFFRTYPFLCGMTGTAADATIEIEGVYSRPVTIIPTNRPIARKQYPMRVFRTQKDKYAAIAQAIEEVHADGRPILVGTRSISTSELLSGLLTQRGLKHQVLNANFDKDEAEVIARAGQGRASGLDPHEAAITVATNMAGRGTDIKLDDAARDAGGLHVILTEMHGAMRIDRQFIGRAGRQGDPGSAQVFVSFEDDLVLKHAPILARILRERSPTPELSAGGLARRVFRLAQSRNEARERRNRAAVLKQDDWIDKYLPGAG